jgi:hypothetical protein
LDILPAWAQTADGLALAMHVSKANKIANRERLKGMKHLPLVGSHGMHGELGPFRGEYPSMARNNGSKSANFAPLFPI